MCILNHSTSLFLYSSTSENLNYRMLAASPLLSAVMSYPPRDGLGPVSQIRKKRGRPRSMVFRYFERLVDDNGKFLGNRCSFCDFISRDRSENSTYLGRHLTRSCNAPPEVREAIEVSKRSRRARNEAAAAAGLSLQQGAQLSPSSNDPLMTSSTAAPISQPSTSMMMPPSMSVNAPRHATSRALFNQGGAAAMQQSLSNHSSYLFSSANPQLGGRPSVFLDNLGAGASSSMPGSTASMAAPNTSGAGGSSSNLMENNPYLQLLPAQMQNQVQVQTQGLPTSSTAPADDITGSHMQRAPSSSSRMMKSTALGHHAFLTQHFQQSNGGNNIPGAASMTAAQHILKSRNNTGNGGTGMTMKREPHNVNVSEMIQDDSRSKMRNDYTSFMNPSRGVSGGLSNIGGTDYSRQYPSSASLGLGQLRAKREPSTTLDMPLMSGSGGIDRSAGNSGQVLGGNGMSRENVYQHFEYRMSPVGEFEGLSCKYCAFTSTDKNVGVAELQQHLVSGKCAAISGSAAARNSQI